MRNSSLAIYNQLSFSIEIFDPADNWAGPRLEINLSSSEEDDQNWVTQTDVKSEINHQKMTRIG